MSRTFSVYYLHSVLNVILEHRTDKEAGKLKIARVSVGVGGVNQIIYTVLMQLLYFSKAHRFNILLHGDVPII